MRAIDCPCGHHFEGADDDALFRRCREHIDRDHPEMERSDEQIRDRIAADAYEAATVRRSAPAPETSAGARKRSRLKEHSR